jgi:hypothetical protein
MAQVGQHVNQVVQAGTKRRKPRKLVRHIPGRTKATNVVTTPLPRGKLRGTDGDVIVRHLLFPHFLYSRVFKDFTARANEVEI